MRPYKRMSKATWTLLIASTLATGGILSVGSQALAQETTTSSLVAPQTQDQSGQESIKGQSLITLENNGKVTNMEKKSKRKE